MTDMRAPVDEELDAWRRGVRAWLETHANPRSHIAGRSGEGDDESPIERAKGFQRRLYESGYAGITWPPDCGGRGLTRDHQIAFNEETAEFEIPTAPLGIGLGMCGPTIIAHGSADQKARYLRPMLRGEEIWCQLFSEPEAGSDLAGVRTRARPAEDGWRLSGQKIWTSVAHLADFGLLLARTDPTVPKHAGLTMFVVGMHEPGVTVRPLREITGDANFNEVFFDDVAVGHHEVLGGVGGGWRAAMTMLASERASIGGAGSSGWRGHTTGRLMDLARRRGLLDDHLLLQELAQLQIMRTALQVLGERLRAAARSDGRNGPPAAVAKLVSAELAQRSSEFGVRVAGLSGVGWRGREPQADGWAKTLLASRAASLAGGTNEVLKNVLGERVLGLPKEPRADKGVPFNELHHLREQGDA